MTKIEFLKSTFFYLIMRTLILVKDIVFWLMSLGMLLFFWVYDPDDYDELTHKMDVTDRKWTRFGR